MERDEMLEANETLINAMHDEDHLKQALIALDEVVRLEIKREEKEEEARELLGSPNFEVIKESFNKILREKIAIEEKIFKILRTLEV